MLRFITQKLIHKKWMVISLLIGNILLIAIACSNPMYKNAALKKMINDEFEQYVVNNNEFSNTVSYSVTLNKDLQSYQKLDDFNDNLSSYLGVPLTSSVRQVNVIQSKYNSTWRLMGEKSASIMNLTNLAEHSIIHSGNMYSNQLTEGGFIEAIITEATMLNLDLVIGEEIEYVSLKDKQGNPIKIRIVGVFANRDYKDEYWVRFPNAYKDCFFIDENIFEEYFLDMEQNKYKIQATWTSFVDYSVLTPDNAKGVSERIMEAQKDVRKAYGFMKAPPLVTIIDNFYHNQNKVVTTLYILQVPVLVLLCAFIFMISSQMLDLEENEIALLKSRGAGRLQIVALYFIQNTILIAISFAIAIPLGSYLCRVLGSANAFLEFVNRRTLDIQMTSEVFVYGLIAALISLAVTLIPVLKRSKVSIVHAKQKRSRRRSPLWQRLGLDIVCLVVSLYGYYAFSKDASQLGLEIMAEKDLDPLLFLSSSLFILGAGLFALRIQPLIVKLVFLIGKRFWKPASYASFLQIIRTGTKQFFIMAFLILTVALGIFNSTVARTILANAEDNASYMNGNADIIIEEIWRDNSASIRAGVASEYACYEPEYARYLTLNHAKSVTRVRFDKVIPKNSIPQTTIMSIHPKEFGETVYINDGLLDEHMNYYLNLLASNPEGVILCSAFEAYGYAVGGRISLTSAGQHANGNEGRFEILAFVDYWPGFAQLEYDEKFGKMTNNLFGILNYEAANKAYALRPYQIWMDYKTDDTSEVYDFIENEKIILKGFADRATNNATIRSNTIFQSTNGILTLSFIVILVLCCAGFLIYWILSIRSRELLFGVFRAMGMAKNEILRMLLNEQLFSSVLAIVLGIRIGAIASVLYVPLIQTAYAAEQQVLPLRLILQSSDILRLLVIIGIVFIICLMILTRIVFKLKIAQALKLGED